MLHKGSAFPADPLSILNGACPSAPEFAAQARHLAPGHYYTRGPAAPKPLSDPAATNLFCHCHQPLCLCHQPFMSLPPTSVVTPTNLFYPDYPFPPQSPAAACRSTDADFCTSRLYHRPGFSTQKAPHHPEYHPATSGYRLNSVSAPHQPA